jgi:hypothetical protein
MQIAIVDIRACKLQQSDIYKSKPWTWKPMCGSPKSTSKGSELQQYPFPFGKPSISTVHVTSVHKNNACVGRSTRNNAPRGWFRGLPPLSGSSSRLTRLGQNRGAHRGGCRRRGLAWGRRRLRVCFRSFSSRCTGGIINGGATATLPMWCFGGESGERERERRWWAVRGVMACVHEGTWHFPLPSPLMWPMEWTVQAP